MIRNGIKIPIIITSIYKSIIDTLFNFLLICELNEYLN